MAGNAVLSNVWFNIATKALLSITNIMVFLFLLDITFSDIINTSPFYNIPSINFNHFNLANQTIRFKKLIFFKKYFYENNMKLIYFVISYLIYIMSNKIDAFEEIEKFT